MRETLVYFLELIRDVDNINEQQFNRLRTLFNGLDAGSKNQFINTVVQVCENDYQNEIFLLSVIAFATEDYDVIDTILSRINRDDIPLTELVQYNWQLVSCIFRYDFKEEFEGIYRKQIINFKRMVEKLWDAIEDKPSYIPPKDRYSKRIVLTMNPLISERHAPSMMMINLVDFLYRAGYEVLVISTNIQYIAEQYSDMWYDAVMPNKVYPESHELNQPMLGVDIKGYSFMLSVENYETEMNRAVHMIREYNPLFVWALGGSDVLGGVCEKFTTTVSMNFCDQMPVTNSKYITRYFLGDDLSRYNLAEDQVLIDAKFSGEKNAFTDNDPKFMDWIRSKCEGAFPIVLLGNRLDDEISDELLGNMISLLESYEQIKYVIIGPCPVLMEKADNSGYRERFIFTGYVSDVSSIFALCKLFLNNPRRGGGSGGWFACINGIPTLTEAYGDVYSTIGDDFVCDLSTGLNELVDRYINDAEFYKSQSEKALNQCDKFSKVDSAGNIKRCCEELTELILNSAK